jgi:hypothetical protein
MAVQFTENVPQMALWSQSIGGFIINFGIAEFLTLRCVEKFAGKQAAIACKKKKLSERINAAKKALASSALTVEEKKRSEILWAEISKLSQTRNRIAHNPLCPGFNKATNQIVWSAIDLKKMVPVGENALEPLDYAEIAGAALRVRDICQELRTLIESAPMK